MTRTVRDGHAETWWAADAVLGWWGPDGARRLVVATADPGDLAGEAIWYLVTNLPRPGGARSAARTWPRRRSRASAVVAAGRCAQYALGFPLDCTAALVADMGPRRPRSPSFRP